MTKNETNKPKGITKAYTDTVQATNNLITQNLVSPIARLRNNPSSPFYVSDVQKDKPVINKVILNRVVMYFRRSE